MDFNITLGPIFDWLLRLLIVGLNIVVWTWVVQVFILEVKSWFKQDEDAKYEDNVNPGGIDAEARRRH